MKGNKEEGEPSEMASGNEDFPTRRESGGVSRNKNDETEGKGTASNKEAAQEVKEKKAEVAVSFSSSSDEKEAERACKMMQF